MKTISLIALKEWIKVITTVYLCSVPIVVNGGGFTWITPNDLQTDEDKYLDALFGEDYDDEVEVLSGGEEYEDFADFLSDDVYKDMTFVRIHHNNSYNQENMDIQLGVWDLDF